MEYQDIKDWMLNHPIESKAIIASLLENDKISIGDLVTLKEMAMRNRIDSMKESLSEGSAIAVMYRNTLYGKGYPTSREQLDERAKSFINTNGYLKVE